MARDGREPEPGRALERRIGAESDGGSLGRDRVALFVRRRDSGARAHGVATIAGLPFLSVSLVNEEDFKVLVNEFFTTDRHSVGKGMVEIKGRYVRLDNDDVHRLGRRGMKRTTYLHKLAETILPYRAARP